MGIEPTSSAWKAEVLPLNYTRADRRPHLPASRIPRRLLHPHREWRRGKDSNLRRRKPADLQSAPVGRLGTPPQNERRIVISLSRGVNASWPGICLPAEGFKVLPPPVTGTPSLPAAEPDGRPKLFEKLWLRQPRAARAHVPRQLDGAVANAQEAADLEPYRLPQAAHLAVASL